MIATFFYIFLWMIVILAKPKNSHKKNTCLWLGGVADYGLRNWLKVIAKGIFR
jgi:hypothetical protein